MLRWQWRPATFRSETFVISFKTLLGIRNTLCGGSSWFKYTFVCNRLCLSFGTVCVCGLHNASLFTRIVFTTAPNVSFDTFVNSIVIRFHFISSLLLSPPRSPNQTLLLQMSSVERWTEIVCRNHKYGLNIAQLNVWSSIRKMRHFVCNMNFKVGHKIIEPCQVVESKQRAHKWTSERAYAPITWWMVVQFFCCPRSHIIRLCVCARARLCPLCQYEFAYIIHISAGIRNVHTLPIQMYSTQTVIHKCAHRYARYIASNSFVNDTE